VAGIGATSLAFAAIAFGLEGIAVVLVIIIVLFFIEIYRDASRLSVEHESLVSDLSEARQENTVGRSARLENAQLREQIEAWKDRNAAKNFDLEELLEGLARQRSLIQAVRAHRNINNSAGGAHVTTFELREDELCVVAAVSSQAVQFTKQDIALVKSGSVEPIAFGPVVRVDGEVLNAQLRPLDLPADLGNELKSDKTVRRPGFLLVLAGTVDPRYREVGDRALERLESHMSELIDSITQAMSSASGQGVIVLNDSVSSVIRATGDTTVAKGIRQKGPAEGRP
jgi:hypothetical protein